MVATGHDLVPMVFANRAINEGATFNILVVGPTGIGKTTLINSIFDFDFCDAPSTAHNLPNVDLHIKTFPSHESPDRKLTIIETKGFNDQLNKSESHKNIINYIDKHFSGYLEHLNKEHETFYEENKDTRVHCCIYLLTPSGTGLKAIDLVTMKQLHERVCLIPVIGKADVLTKHEVIEMKARIMKEINLHGIKIYKPEETSCLMPFAISASNDSYIEKGKKVRTRLYPWGKLSIEQHSDFCHLRNLITRADNRLVQQTKAVHYERLPKELVLDIDSLDQEVNNLQTENRGILRDLEKVDYSNRKPLY